MRNPAFFVATSLIAVDIAAAGVFRLPLTRTRPVEQLVSVPNLM